MNIEQEINSLKANPILFKTDMVRAIREDRKTETRRIIKPQPIFDRDYLGNRKIKINKNHYISINYITKSPYGEPGDYLWVHETWSTERKYPLAINSPNREAINYIYKADKLEHISKLMKWKSSTYMPKSACRLILKIEDLGVERIQDITEESAINGQKSWDKNIFVWRIKFSKYIQM